MTETHEPQRLLTSKELGMAVAEKLGQGAKQPEVRSPQTAQKHQVQMRRPLLSPPSPELRAQRHAKPGVQRVTDEVTTPTSPSPHRPEGDVADRTAATSEQTADSVKTPQIDESLSSLMSDILITSPAQAELAEQYHKYKDSLQIGTGGEGKTWVKWEEWVNSPERLEQQRRLRKWSEWMNSPEGKKWREEVADPLTKKLLNIMDGRMQDEQGNWKVPLPTWIKRWDAQGREQHWQTPRDKELIAYREYLATLSPEEHIILWEVNQQRMKNGLPALRTIEEVRLRQSLQELIKDMAPTEETKNVEELSWREWIAYLSSVMIAAKVAGATAEEAEKKSKTSSTEKMAA